MNDDKDSKRSEASNNEEMSQRRRHTHDSVFRGRSNDTLDDPLYETMYSYAKNRNERNNSVFEEDRYVTINELSQKFHKKLTKVHDRRPTKKKIQRPVSVTLPASSCYSQQHENNTICDQWLQVLQQQSHDDNDRCLQHIHRTSRRRSANILRETRSNDFNQHSKTLSIIVDKNNNENDLLDDDKIIAYTTLQKQKLFTKERRRSCDKLHDVCFGPLLL